MTFEMPTTTKILHTASVINKLSGIKRYLIEITVNQIIRRHSFTFFHNHLEPLILLLVRSFLYSFGRLILCKIGRMRKIFEEVQSMKISKQLNQRASHTIRLHLAYQYTKICVLTRQHFVKVWLNCVLPNINAVHFCYFQKQANVLTCPNKQPQKSNILLSQDNPE